MYGCGVPYPAPPSMEQIAGCKEYTVEVKMLDGCETGEGTCCPRVHVAEGQTAAVTYYTKVSQPNDRCERVVTMQVTGHAGNKVHLDLGVAADCSEGAGGRCPHLHCEEVRGIHHVRLDRPTRLTLCKGKACCCPHHVEVTIHADKGCQSAEVMERIGFDGACRFGVAPVPAPPPVLPCPPPPAPPLSAPVCVPNCVCLPPMPCQPPCPPGLTAPMPCPPCNMAYMPGMPPGNPLPPPHPFVPCAAYVPAPSYPSGAVSCCMIRKDGKTSLEFRSPDGTCVICKRLCLKSSERCEFKLSAGAKRIHVGGRSWKACADQVEMDGGRLMLTGHVHLTSDEEGQHTVLKAERVCVEPGNGHLEVRAMLE
jgi:hypothetical protein